MFVANSCTPCWLHLARLLWILVSIVIAVSDCTGGLLDMIGANLLRQTTTNLNGQGIAIGQVEAPETGASPPTFEVTPGSATVMQPGSKFVYRSSAGTATNYPNAVGGPSSHATEVGRYLYGLSSGVTTNPAAIYNYDANHFINSVVLAVSPPVIPRIVNQSFIAGDITIPQQITFDQAWDDYADANNTLFVSGVGNADTNYYGGAVNVPASCYNGIAVAAFGTVNSSVGPTRDNGRCKPDITAPNQGASLVTSFTTPFVSGSAAILLQAALRGDGGSDTNAASDMRTLKALLLNGAVKPNGWTNGPSTPLDARHGAGMVNLFNSYRQLTGGKYSAIEQTSAGTVAAHPPGSNPGNITEWSGWNYDTTLSSTATQNFVKHYYFDLTNESSAATFTLTATLAWNRQETQTAINDLDLFLYDCASSNLVAESVSGVDNVEHLYVQNLPPGRYDLQVLKYGGTIVNGRVTSGETYALAWEFFNLPLAVSPSDTNVVLSWPIYPAGFVVESTTALSAPSWTTNHPAPVIINGTNTLTLPANAGQRFFRLRRPAY